MMPVDAKQQRNDAAIPREERLQPGDSLPTKPDPSQPETEMDDPWVTEAQQRLGEIRSGTATPVPAEDVFRKLRDRLQGGEDLFPAGYGRALDRAARRGSDS